MYTTVKIVLEMKSAWHDEESDAGLPLLDIIGIVADDFRERAENYLVPDPFFVTDSNIEVSLFNDFDEKLLIENRTVEKATKKL